MRIGDNPSLSISRQLAQSQARISRALGRLSSGLRLNRFGEDSASFSTSVRLGSQLRGMAQLAQGWNQARGLLETSSAAMSSQTEIVQRMREIAVRASSSLLGSAERASLNQELLSLREEFARITQTTEFAGMKLLNGSMDSFSILTSSGSSSLSLDLPSSSLDQVFQKTVGTGAFSLTASFDVGEDVSRSKAGDLNANGRQDLVSLNIGDNMVVVSLGQGDGSFSSVQTIAVGANSSTIELADLNGNGVLDLVVNYGTLNQVGVFMGQGDGRFGAATTYAVGDRPVDLKLGDVNGDGILDIVTANRNGNSISILLGNGDGSFQEQQTIAASGPTGLMLADLNNNGTLDILTLNSAAGSITTFLGDGSGSFSSASTYVFTGTSAQFALDDLTKNGILDIVLYSFDFLNGDVISVLEGNGDGSFKSGATFSAGSAVNALQLKDVNGDGQLDLIQSGNNLRIYHGNGDGSFGSPKIFNTGPNTNSTEFADLNSNGILDLIVSTSTGVLSYLAKTKNVSAVSDLSVLSLEASQELVGVLDEALQRLSGSQAKIGSQLSRLDAMEAFSLSQQAAIAEASDQLTQADFAAETAELVAAQILQQVQVASLVQANTQMQVVLELLRPLL